MLLRKPLTAKSEPEPYRFSVEDWRKLGEAGLFDGDDRRVELLDGEIIVMSPIGDRHMFAMSMLTEAFVEQGRRRYLVWPGNSVEADRRSEPVPDLALVPRQRSRKKGPPFTRETYLIVEIADSSLRYDRGRKLQKYARTGVAEYWIVNLQEDVIEVYTQPKGDGYEKKQVFESGARLSPHGFPDVVISVNDLILRG